jgi:hypothetical protein
LAQIDTNVNQGASYPALTEVRHNGDMEYELKIVKIDGELDGDLVPVGPTDAELRFALEIPSSFARKFVNPKNGLAIELHCTFDGDKANLTKLVVEKGSTGITTRELGQLKLPFLIQLLCHEVIPNAKHWTGVSNNQAERQTYAFMAQLYWFEHISWGNPRMRLMELFEWPKSTASYQLRKLNQQWSLPGIHSKK